MVLNTALYGNTRLSVVDWLLIRSQRCIWTDGGVESGSVAHDSHNV